MKVTPRRNIAAEIAEWEKRKGPATKALPEFTGKAWSEQDMLACRGFITGHWQQCLVSLDLLYSTINPPESAAPVRIAACESAIKHLDLMRLAMDELTAELKTRQAQERSQ